MQYQETSLVLEPKLRLGWIVKIAKTRVNSKNGKDAENFPVFPNLGTHPRAARFL